MTISELTRDYRNGSRTPAGVVTEVFDRIDRDGLAPVWISVMPREQAIARARAVDPALPLGGIPFAVKDNIDVEGLPTTAGCPSFAYMPERSATVVSRLLAAGAVLIGKTNMDQFATGLTGTRSPYGACANVFDSRYISGGSSSGSAVAVAKGLCAFALGTDTAGSGRVPAAFNDLVGVKPTRGLVSAAGVVPACRSLDCVSVFASTADDAAAVLRVAQGPDVRDPYSRQPSAGDDASPWVTGRFRFGRPAPAALEFFGDGEARALYEAAVARLESIGGVPVTIDYTPFRDAAALLYAGPWVAERLASIGGFLDGDPGDLHPVVGNIVRGGERYSAADAFKAAYRLEALKQQAAVQWRGIDVLALPTTGTIYTRAQIDDDPIALNSNLGVYTNFVNLMDLAAVAVPAGFRRNGLPFGISLIGPAFSDSALLALAERFDVRSQASAAAAATRRLDAPGCIAVAVVGAHLTGEPLNGQLIERGARLIVATRTAPAYRLYALPATTPAKPGLARVAERGAAIDVEVWSVPEDRFGSFVAAVPPPLGIGSVQLESGEWVKGFICEPMALTGAEDITAFGGWRAYRASLHATAISR